MEKNVRNTGLLVNGKEKPLDAIKGGVYPFKTININLDDLERTLKSEPQTTAPIIEGMSDIPQYNT